MLVLALAIAALRLQAVITVITNSVFLLFMGSEVETTTAIAILAMVITSTAAVQGAVNLYFKIKDGVKQ